MDVDLEAWVSQLRKGLVELAVLGLLAGEAKYGSQLVDELAAHPRLAISAGTVYPLLSRLKKSGLVESAWQESPLGPPRKYYSLTAAGRAAFGSMSTVWRLVTAEIDTLLEES